MEDPEDPVNELKENIDEKDWCIIKIKTTIMAKVGKQHDSFKKITLSSYSNIIIIRFHKDMNMNNKI